MGVGKKAETRPTRGNTDQSLYLFNYHKFLQKKIVMYLSELREAEQLYAKRETQKKLMQERIEEYQLKPKGNEEIY
jgi:hypothetical protein